MGWNPIETAPKDGTVVDLWADRDRYANSYFGFDSWGKGPLWVYSDPSDGYIVEVKNPTHWMPLPEAPNE